MFGVVKIGEKPVEMLGNAATPYRYQMIFGEDYLARVTGKDKRDGRDFFAKVGYVMAMQARKEDMKRLNPDTFMEWLEGFEPSDVFAAASDIADLYNGNGRATVDPKEKEDRQSEN